MTANVVELFTETEWVRFYDAAQQAARARGSVFVLDESVRMVSERAWAAYLRDTMTGAGVDDLAARIVPENYPQSELVDQLAALSSRRNGARP
uniref:hypothetical protein n=1 Tax=Cryobacterium sp. TaxID=1926290 RepID=UPI0015999F0F|nr:hypothetical protein [Cryobacterium sp.]QJS06055.1 hypothetical protein [Cryobacterium sp.]